MSSPEKDEIIDTMTDWMEEVGADAYATLLDEKGTYVLAKGKKVYVPDKLVALFKTL